jgi:serine/threonine protein kinase
LEFVPGGEMLEHVVRDGAFGEADAARLMHELASALSFLHNADICHADLKPENILLSSASRNDGHVKLIDFGCAVVKGIDDGTQFLPARRRKHQASADSTGTTAYWAPERFNKGLVCDAPMDCWAVGVILYIMLVGLHPYDLSGVSTDADIREQLCTDPTPPLGPEMVGHLSPSAVDLLSRLLETDPSKRMTASEMLEHPWITGQLQNSVQHTKRESSKVTMRSSTYILTGGKEMNAPDALL